MNRLLGLAAVSLPLLTSGCLFRSDTQPCHKPREYQAASTGELARVPEDLNALPEEARLELPEGGRNTSPTPKGEPCLIDPPSYTDSTSN